MIKLILFLMVCCGFSSCAVNNDYQIYVPIMRAEGIKFRNREFISVDLKDWNQIKDNIDGNGNIDWVWIPQGQTESSWVEKFDIRSNFVPMEELSKHSAIESKNALLSGFGDDVQVCVLSVSDLEVLFEVTKKGDSFLWLVTKIVHDTDFVRYVTYAKQAEKMEDIDRELWINNVKKIDLGL